MSEPLRTDAANMGDCYRIAFAAGAGFTAGVCAVVGLGAVIHAILHAVFG